MIGGLSLGARNGSSCIDADTRIAQTCFGDVASFAAYNGDFPAPVWGVLTEYGYGEVTQKGSMA